MSSTNLPSSGRVKYERLRQLFLKMMVSGIQTLADPDLLRERHKCSKINPQSYLPHVTSDRHDAARVSCSQHIGKCGEEGDRV